MDRVLCNQVNEWANYQGKVAEDKQSYDGAQWENGVHLMHNKSCDFNLATLASCFNWPV